MISRETVDSLPKVFELLGLHHAEKIGGDNIPLYRVDDPQKLLEELLSADGLFSYLFHGSTSQVVESLEPRTAHGTTEQGRRLAVYATNCPIKALFWALTGGIKNEGGMLAVAKMSVDERTGEVTYDKIDFRVENEGRVRDGGYVYVFANQGFEYSDGEYLSSRAVLPLFGIQIKKEDFRYPIRKST